MINRKFNALSVLVLFFRIINGHHLCADEPPQSTCIKPHILFIFADDLGWNDVGWQNKDVHTPNLDKLAMEGIRLNHSYMLPLCSPSRSAVMSGYYPFRTGMQRRVITTTHPFGLPLKFPTFANKLKESGYSTHIIGKWNLGFCNWNYTPTYRGFDSFFGFYEPVEHYYSHLTYSRGSDFRKSGYDFRNNTKLALEYKNIHSSVPFVKQAKRIIESHNSSEPLLLYLPTQYVHVPEEVPHQYYELYNNSNVTNTYRKGFMARVSALDDDIGQIISSLKESGLYNNTVILFSADNGGHPYSGGCNYPLRGSKATLYEGGTRAVSFVHSPMLHNTGTVYNGMMHAVDWFATIVALGGGKLDSSIDGMNMWPAIRSNLESPRKEFVYHMDDDNGHLRTAIRVNEWKLIFGKAGVPSFWYPPEDVKGTFVHEYFESDIEEDWSNISTIQLYNLKDDPLETKDLSTKMPQKVKELKERILFYQNKMVPALYKNEDPSGDPEHFGGIVSPGWCKTIYDPVEIVHIEDNIQDESSVNAKTKSHQTERSASSAPYSLKVNCNIFIVLTFISLYIC